ncbi:alpha-1,2-mannosyltransferase ktr1 [Coemansia sp. RSA 1813]|nr:alpha-1,2-mannosyltransferase ktr1 [Coemansia sp. RSA 1843]KAJ2212066.1 alpha-1,2-mannosyltransferase ktr1 [Coemansia sp. RSA 487]KAJ2572251.1 alpha-1,2-mannosyltransferase ktr1 [Coemansia sp. RSA 1813]
MQKWRSDSSPGGMGPEGGISTDRKAAEQRRPSHQRILGSAVILLAAIAALVLFVANPPPIERARMLTYSPSQIRESRLKHANTGRVYPVRAAFVILVRNSELHDLRATVRQLEDQFNKRHHYAYVFLNNEPFTEEFKQAMEWATTGDCHFGLVPYEHWSMPPWVDRVRARRTMAMMADKVPYGDSESYRKMCRYESGFFFQHPLLDNFDYYWRVEPGVEFTCAIPYDPFKYMVDHNKLYGFTISLIEFPITVKTLWQTTNAFRATYPGYIAPNNTLDWVTAPNGSYNMCHFWSNFEIASLDFFRSPAYTAYFDFLDRAGGFFLERWGDAPVHSLAVSMLLNKEQVHYFDIGYLHKPFQNCPIDPDFNDMHCFCNPNRSAIYNPDSCTKAWLAL